MLRAITTASILVAVAGLSGCVGSGGRGSSASTSFDEMTPTQIAAWSATSKYPEANGTPRRMDVAVIVNKDQKTIKVYNFTGEAVRNAKLWVNKTFVAQIDGIAPGSKVLVRTDRLYDGVGNAFAKQKLEVSAVQLQTEQGLFDLHGPASE